MRVKNKIHMNKCDIQCIFLYLYKHQNSLHHVKLLIQIIKVQYVLYVVTNSIHFSPGIYNFIMILKGFW